MDSMGGVWGGVSPPKSGEYNLKLISTLYNDSIPEKSGVDVSTPVHPVATPLVKANNAQLET